MHKTRGVARCFSNLQPVFVTIFVMDFMNRFWTSKFVAGQVFNVSSVLYNYCKIELSSGFSSLDFEATCTALPLNSLQISLSSLT